MHQMDLEFEHGWINNVAIWKRGVKVYSLSVREESVCLASAWLCDGELHCNPWGGRQKGATVRNNTSCVKGRLGTEGCRTTDRLSHHPCVWWKIRLLLKHLRQGVTWWRLLKEGGVSTAQDGRNGGMWQEHCVFAYVCLYVCSCTVIVLVEVGVASLCGTPSREQVGSGWCRESVLIVFLP